MSRCLALLLALALGAPARDAVAQDLNAQVQARNALSDMARAQRDQAETLRRLDQRDRDRATREEWDRNNAKRDARSLRPERFENNHSFR